MKKRIVAAITGGVWLAAIGSAVALTYALDRPLQVHQVGRYWPARDLEMTAPRQVVDEQREVGIAPQVLEMPAMVVLGHLDRETVPSDARTRGATEMQAPDDLVIGPGVVTHPSDGAAKGAR